jgi:hypothetical protein
MKRHSLTLPQLGSTYPFKLGGVTTLRTVESVDLGCGTMVLTSPDYPPRKTFINDVVELVRPNDATAWLPVLREHYAMDAAGRAALIAEARATRHSDKDFDRFDNYLLRGENIEEEDFVGSGPHEAMGPVCAFPQAPIADLHRDLYATLGDPVPVLRWPRQESEQSPARSELPSPESPSRRFKVGDHVVFSHHVGHDCGNEGAPPLGWAGVVTDDDRSDLPLRVVGVPWRNSPTQGAWWFLPEALELAADGVAPAFSVGARVMVAKKVEWLSRGRSAGWESPWMDATVGKTGRVTDVSAEHVTVQMDTVGGEWSYAPEALTLIVE